MFCSNDTNRNRRAITPRTKIIIVNTPHNPIGKVFTRPELEAIATIAEEFNLLVMADEVVCLQRFIRKVAHNSTSMTA
jgi:kynurenine aminotransferase